MQKKRVLFLLMFFAFFATHEILAVPAVPWPVEKYQPDGTKITVLLKGDEKVHWMESLDGYSLMYDAQKYVVYAEQDAAGNMIPSKVRFGEKSAKTDNFKKGLQYSKSQLQSFEQIWKVTSDAESSQLRSSGPQKAGATVGNRKALCVLMGFSDRAFSKQKDEFETLFNQVGLYNSNTKGSVRDFFRENSYGELDFTVTIVGPYVAPNTCKYYATHEREFAETAARAADNDVDFNDFADGSTLETFHILFAGYGDEAINNGNQIWSHKWQLASPISLDGVRISVYSCSPELRGSSGNNTTYIGVVCHELSHVFGAPDYYDTGSVGYTGSGKWDLMADGSWNDNGRQPGHINMFQKILYGWVTPTSLTSFAEITNMPPSAVQPVAYTIKANDNGELYVLENRQQVGFDASLPGHGLLIWHVHSSALSGRGSNAAHPQQLYPVVASSSYAIPTATAASYGNINSTGTPFPGSAENHAFTAKTTPTMFTWTGTTGQAIAKPLTEINEAGDKTISFKFLDGPTVPVTNLDATVTGGNVTLTWTAANHADALGYKIYRDGILQYTINSKSTVTYTQIGVTNGTYEYGVSAFYEATESTPATKSVTVSTGSDNYRLPPTNLQGRATRNNAYLTWTRPFNAGWMTVAGSATTAYRFNSEFTFFAGTLWGPEQLKGLDGYDATQIRFYLNETTAGVTHTVKIYEVDASGEPQEVRSQAYTGARTAGQKDVTLTTPLAIDATKEYLIGVEIHTLGGGCFIVDGNPILPERNWFCENGEWFTLEDVDFENNFFTSVYLNSGNPSSPNPNVVLDSRTQKVSANSLNTFAQKAKNTPAQSSLLKAGKSTLIEGGPSYAAPAITKYIVYRDGVEVGQPTTTSFDDSGLSAGTTYSYCVSSVYNNSEASEGVCMELITLAPVNAFNPVENVKAKAAGDDITVTWEAPYTGGTATYITSTSAPSSTNVSTPTHTEAIRFEPNDLKRMEGFEITSVRFHPGNSNTARTYTIQIWSGGNGTTPGLLLYEQPATFTNNVWTTVQLTSPVEVNIYEDLWIGVKITRTGASGSYPSSRFTTGGVNGKSNLWHDGTAWAQANNVIFPITATITPGSGVASLTGYEILRNGGTPVAIPTSSLSYTDEGLQPGTYNYCVAAVYGADKSDAACASAIAENPVNPYKPVEKLSATLVENTATLNWEAPFTEGRFGYSATTASSAMNATGVMAARFTKEELKMLFGTKLTRVYFATHSTVTTANTTYALRIYAGAKGDEPERVIYDQAISTFATSAWNTVTLTTPIDINVYEDLWIGIVVTSRSGTAYRMSVDAGPSVNGKGNAMYYNNAWTTLFTLNNSYTNNWCILGYVEPGSSMNAPAAILSHDDVPVLPEEITSGGDFKSIAFDKSEAPVLAPDAPALAGSAFAHPDNYLILRDGQALATVGGSVLTYDDILPATGDYTYSVIAQYSGDKQSDARTVTVSFQSECDAKPENVTAERTGNTVAIDWDFTRIIPREEVLFSESFESGIPTEWKNIDADDDARKWTAIAGIGAEQTGGFVVSASYESSPVVMALTPDNWLISTAIPISEANRLNYYVMPNNATYPADHYGVYISTTDADIASFSATPLLEETLAAPASWQKRTIDLSDYDGETVYIAFRHFNCTDEVRMQLDEVSITKDKDPVFYIYENGIKIDEVAGDTHYEKALTQEGSYTYCVSFKGLYCESELVCAGDAIVSKPLTFTLLADKEYDATTDAYPEVTFAGLDASDELSEGVDYTISAQFDDAQVADNVPVNGTIDLLSTAADKYWLQETVIATTGNITPRTLTISGLSADNKVYDGTTDVDISGTALLDNTIVGEDVSLIEGTAQFNSRNANSNAQVIFSGFLLDGADKDNYTLSLPEVFAEISPMDVSISGLSAEHKTYDGTANAVVSGTAVLSATIDGDDIALIEGSAQFEHERAGQNKTVFFTGYRLTGAHADNYHLNQPGNVTAHIHKGTFTYTLPEGLSSLIGKTLADIVLPAGFAWATPETALTAAGEYVFTLIYTPEDTENYETITGIEVVVIVRTGTLILAVGQENELIAYPVPLYAGQTLTVEADLPETALENAFIYVYDMKGAVLKQEKVTGRQTKVQMNVSKGTYLLRLKDKAIKVIVK